MRITRLARFLELKYNLKSEAASSGEILRDVKLDLTRAYNEYANPRKPNKAYNILLLLASRGEYYSQRILDLMQEIIDNIDTKNVQWLFDKVNDILSFISETQGGNVRESIHNSFENFVNKQTKNERMMMKSKWEQVINHKLSNLLKKQAEKLKGLSGSTEPIKGGPQAPIPREKTDQEIFMWRNTSKAAQQYGLDDPQVWSIVSADEDLIPELRKLINATKDVTASIPDYPNITNAVDRAKMILSRQKNNLLYFEAGEDEAKEMENPHFIFHQLKKEKLEEEVERQEINELEKTRLQELIKKRDEESKKREIEEDRERHIKSEGYYPFLDKLLKGYL